MAGFLPVTLGHPREYTAAPSRSWRFVMRRPKMAPLSGIDTVKCHSPERFTRSVDCL